jgi:hypothetical protein
VFGTGRTAIKGSVGRYLAGVGTSGAYSAANPTSQLATTATRTWTDSNRNFNADCDLLNPNAQNLTAQGGDICAAS